MFEADVAMQMKARRKKNVKKGVLFSIMVCGASGTGTEAETEPARWY